MSELRNNVTSVQPLPLCKGCRAGLRLNDRREHYDPIMGAWINCTEIGSAVPEPQRYRAERTGHGFWPYCVRAGNGTRELLTGHKKQMERAARALNEAFADGVFVGRGGRSE